MECDSVHSVIERCLRNQDIYVPAEYVTLMKKAQSKPNPYEVRYVDHNFFQDFTKLRLCKSSTQGSNPLTPLSTMSEPSANYQTKTMSLSPVQVKSHDVAHLLAVKSEGMTRKPALRERRGRAGVYGVISSDK